MTTPWLLSSATTTWLRSLRLAAPLLLLAACGGKGAAHAPTVAPGPPGAPRVSGGTLEARPLLGDLPSRAGAAGAGPVAIVASGPMSENERLGAFVDIPRDQCLLAYARASASLEDIDLAAFAEEGNPVALDEGPDPRPTFMICPPHPDRVYLAIHAAAGAGLAVAAAQLVPRERADDVARAAGARGAIAGPTRGAEAWRGLDDQVRAHRAALGGTWEELRRVAVAVDARAVSAVGFVVEENGCTDALVVPGVDVAVLDVDVLDSEGRLVARAHDTGAARSITVCSPVALNGTLEVRPHVGRGVAAVVIAKTRQDGARDLAAKPEIAWVAPAAGLEQTRAAKNALLAKAGYPAPSESKDGQLTLGRRTTIPVVLPGQGCARIDVVAGAPLALVEASAWDDGGALLASADGADGATLFACGKGKARIDLGTRGRPGPFAILVRSERWKDPAFGSHALASSRMLARAADGPSSLHEGAAGTVRHVVLDSSRQSVYTTNIPPGRCLRLSVGAEGEGTGLELRVVDAVSGDELDRSHGQTSGSVRACAGPSAVRSVRVEARATAGKLDAVIGERVTGP